MNKNMAAYIFSTCVDQNTLSPIAEIFLLCGNVYLAKYGYTVQNMATHLAIHKPELRPEPGVSTVKICVHLEVVLKVLFHLGLGNQLTVLDHNYAL